MPPVFAGKIVRTSHRHKGMLRQIERSGIIISQIVMRVFPSHPLRGIGRVLAGILVASALLGHTQAWGQSAPGIDIRFGYLSTPEDVAISYPVRYDCDCPGGRSVTLKGFVPSLGFTLPSLFTPDLGLSFRVGGTRLSGGGTDTLPQAFVQLEYSGPGSTPVPVRQVIVSRQTIQSWSVQFDLLGSYRLPLGLVLEAGGSIGYRKYDKLDIVMDLLEPANARFLNPEALPTEHNGRVIIYYKGPWPEARPLTLDAVANLSWPVAIGNAAIVPELTFRKEFRTPANDLTWPTTYIGGGIAIRYRLGEEEIMEERASVPPPAPLPLAATIDLYSTTPDGTRSQSARVRSGTLLQRRSIQLPPALFFETGSAAIPARYQRAPGTFHPDSLARMAPGDAYHHLLDLAGWKLKNTPTMKLRLVPIPGTGELPELARRRAGEVRDYLVKQWGASPGQIAIAPPEPAGETGSVRLELPDGLTAASEWRERYFRSTPVELDPAIEGGHGAKRWAISLTQGDRELARRTSGGSEGGSLNLNTILRQMSAGEHPSPLVAELRVEDATGASVTVRDELPFLLEAAPAGDAGYDSIAGKHVLFLTGKESDLEEALRRIDLPADAAGAITIVAGSQADAEQVAAALRRMLSAEQAGAITVTMTPSGEGSEPDGKMPRSAVTLLIESRGAI